MFNENGGVCPYNYFNYTSQDISKYYSRSANQDPRNKKRKFSDPYFVNNNSYLSFSDQKTFEIRTNELEKEPIVNFYIGPNKPCFAADKPHWEDREGIDKTFREPSCDSKFQGSKKNY